MKKLTLAFIFMLFLTITQTTIFAQSVSINEDGSSADNSAMLDVTSIAKGLLIPRMTEAQKNSIPSPAQGLLVYQINGTIGFYYYDGAWKLIGSNGYNISLNLNGTNLEITDEGGTLIQDLSSLQGGTAWNLTGNAGTTPGTNFLGTTDAADFIIKTNDTSRVFVASTGQVSVNTITPFGGDVFSSWSGGTNYAVNGYNDSTGIGVYGQNTSTGVGVYGINTNADGFGIYGMNTDVNGTGVISAGNDATPSYLSGGSGGAFTGTNTGVYGKAAASGGAGVYGSVDISDGFGVEGINTDVSGTGIIGVGNGITGSYLTEGSGIAGSSSNVGVYGKGDNTAGSYGAYFLSEATDGTGIVGAGNNISPTTLTNGSGGAFSGNNVGVFALGDNTAGSYGAYFLSEATDGTGVVGAGNNISPTTLTNGSGGAFSGDNVGVFALGDNTAGSYGAYGLSDASDGIGVFGVCNNSSPAYYGGSGLGGNINESANYAVFGLNEDTDTDGGSAVGVFGGTDVTSITSNATIGVLGYTTQDDLLNYWGLFAQGRIGATGTKSAIMKTSKGENTLLFCMESPEVWFEDFGSGKLNNGSVHIDLGPIFIEVCEISKDHPIHVFVQPTGEVTNQLIVIHDKDYLGFTVKESNSGTSNITFSYRLVAKRRGDADERFPVAKPVALKKQQVSKNSPVTKKVNTLNTKDIIEKQEVKSENKREIKIEKLNKKNINRQ
jgi:hypothetical protein